MSSPFDFTNPNHGPEILDDVEILNDQPARHEARRPKTGADTLASLAMAVGLASIVLGCGVILGPVAIALGGLSLANQGEGGDRGSAVIGLVAGLAGTVVGAALAGYFVLRLVGHA